MKKEISHNEKEIDAQPNCHNRQRVLNVLPRKPALSLDAHLVRLHLQSPTPAALADFYARCYGMQQRVLGETHLCDAPKRAVHISPGQVNQLHYALWACNTQASWELLRARTAQLPRQDLSGLTDLPADALGVQDPQGLCLVFVPPQSAPAFDAPSSHLPAATNQHFAVRTQQIETLVAFYTEQLGFIVSDRVQDDSGQLTACFLRTEHLHHCLALFGAPVNCFDHQSFETPSWNDLKDWADHMGRLRTEIVWGVGRHGPGNDVFFMVRDPDGNLTEISSEIEVCAPDRPMGVWPHEERTLNVWGRAIMRS